MVHEAFNKRAKASVTLVKNNKSIVKTGMKHVSRYQELILVANKRPELVVAAGVLRAARRDDDKLPMPAAATDALRGSAMPDNYDTPTWLRGVARLRHSFAGNVCIGGFVVYRGDFYCVRDIALASALPLTADTVEVSASAQRLKAARRETMMPRRAAVLLLRKATRVCTSADQIAMQPVVLRDPDTSERATGDGAEPEQLWCSVSEVLSCLAVRVEESFGDGYYCLRSTSVA